MTTSRFRLFAFFLVFICFINWAFYDPYGNEQYDNVPGVIQVIAHAGNDRTFTFEKWKISKLQWEVGKYEDINIEILIDAKSLSNSWKDLEKNIRKKKDYFYVKKFPTIVAKINGAEKVGESKYRSEMELELKGVKRSVPIEFEIDDQNFLKVSGDGTLNRRDFKFNGDGPEDEVDLKFQISLPDQNI